MKRRLLMLLSVFMTITSVGWLQAADIVWTVDATRTEADTQTAFKTLKAAVQAANNLGGIDKLVITVEIMTSSGLMRLPETVIIWLLPVTMSKLSEVDKSLLM